MLARRVYALSVLLGGVTILRKGLVDVIASSRGDGKGPAAGVYLSSSNFYY